MSGVRWMPFLWSHSPIPRADSGRKANAVTCGFKGLGQQCLPSKGPQAAIPEPGVPDRTPLLGISAAASAATRSTWQTGDGASTHRVPVGSCVTRSALLNSKQALKVWCGGLGTVLV